MASFQDMYGSAETTPLESHSVDFIVSAQAFHWFDRKLAKSEFSRILRPNGKVVLIWNNRHTDQNLFDRSYENLLLKYGKDYEQVKHTNINEDDLNEFFRHSTYAKRTFVNHQDFDFNGLKGRLLSSSYIPSPHEENYQEMIEELKKIFNQCNENGKVAFYYDTEIYYGEA